jgi:hypothetical protein
MERDVLAREVAAAEIAGIEDFLQALDDLDDAVARGQRPVVKVIDLRDLIVSGDDLVDDTRQFVLVVGGTRHLVSAPKP